MTDNAQLSLDLDNNEYDSDDDETLRANAGFNSPKANKAMTFDDDNKNMNLDVDGVDEEEYDVSPNTQKRDSAGINSPRAQKQHPPSDFNPALAGLVTQVPRDDAPAGMITQVPRDDDTTQAEISKKLSQQPKAGFCSCLSCLFTCCSGPVNSDIEMQGSSVPVQDESKDRKQMSVPSSSAIPVASSNEAATDTVPTGNTEDNQYEEDEDESASSTDYDNIALLPPLAPLDKGKKCLVLDLDETLVHSSFKPIPDPHFIIPVEIDRVVHHVYVLKRPYVDEFMLRASKQYEIVIFTASLSKYADPLLDKLDIHNVIAHRLFRESCVIHGTAYVKDLRKLGRKLKDCIIVDNSPPSYLFQPTNAIPIASWFDDESDTQLLDLCPVLETTMDDVKDVRCLLDANVKTYRWLCQQSNKPANEFTTRNDLLS